MTLAPRQHSFAPARARISFRFFLKGTDAHIGQPDIQSLALPLCADQINSS